MLARAGNHREKNTILLEALLDLSEIRAVPV
jgi:hypothetical protein